ncbi:hypothetical protein IMSAGC013_04196 [Lachnospiraceae bacterium]|nr:hypothetical protein IMSAGC013_04196 [Lachnospiraceae bacterium]
MAAECRYNGEEKSQTAAEYQYKQEWETAG